jgi:hypothetical protein
LFYPSHIDVAGDLLGCYNVIKAVWWVGEGLVGSFVFQAGIEVLMRDGDKVKVLAGHP